jgi:hypothetical protein
MESSYFLSRAVSEHHEVPATMPGLEEAEQSAQDSSSSVHIVSRTPQTLSIEL